MNNSLYNGYAVYRFLNNKNQTIYIGRSKSVYNRIYKQHFTSRGHLSSKCYSDTCLVEIIKLDNNAECKALEDYLIEQYRPYYNKQDKSKSYSKQSFGALESQLANMEKWKRYRFFKEFDSNSIQEGKRNAVISYIFCMLFFIGILYQFIIK